MPGSSDPPSFSATPGGADAATRRALTVLEYHIDNSPMAVTEWRTDGRIVRWSAGAQRIFGWTREELEARSHEPGWGMVHPDDLPRVGPQFDALLRGDLPRFTCTNRNIRKDGSVIWCEWFNSALTDEHGRVVSVLSQATDQTERVEAERRAQDASDRLAFHLDNSPVAVTEWGADFRWLRWSGGAERMFGYAASEVIGRRFLDMPFIDPADLPALQERMDLLLGGKLPRFSAMNRNIRRDGSVIWCEWHNSALLDSAGNVVSVLSQAVDVTDRVRAEQEARSTRELLEAHLNNSPIAVVEWGPDFRFTRWSAGAERIFGYAAGEMVGVSFAEMDPPLIHPDDRDAVMEHVRQLLAREARRLSITCRNLRRDGKPVWMNWHSSAVFDAGGNLVSVLTQGVDVTERVQAEQMLRESEERFREMAECMPAVVWTMEPDRGCTYTNRRWEELTGQDPALAQGDGWEAWVHGDDRPGARAVFERALQTRRPFRTEFRVRTRDGRERWMLDSGAPRLTPDGRLLGFVGTLTDITDRKAGERVLRRSVQQLTLLNDAVKALLAADHPSGLAPTLFETICAEFELDGFLHYEVSEDGRRLHLAASGGLLPDVARARTPLELGQELCGTTAQTRRPVYAERLDCQDEPRAPWLREAGFRAYACNPLLIGDRLLGTLAFVSRRRDRFAEEELAFFATVTQYASVAQERLDAAEALRQREQQFRAVVEHMPVLLDAFDADGTPIFWNAECERVTGYGRDEVIGNPSVWERLYPDAAYLARMNEEWARRAEGYRDWEWSLTRSDGTERIIAWSNVSGQAPVPGWTTWGVGVDVTERRRAEEQARAALRRLEFHLDNSPTAIVEWSADARVMRWSPGAERISGFTAAEMVGKHVLELDLFHPEDRAVARQRMTLLMSGELARGSHTYRCLCKDGRVIHVRWSSSVLFDDAGKVVSILSQGADITDRVVMEQQLRDEKARTEAASRAKDRFIASLSHELRTPLTPARVLLSVLKDDPRLPAEVRSDLVIAHRNVQAESRLIDDLLDVTRLVRGDFEFDLQPCDARPLIDAAVSSTRAALDGKVLTLHTELSASEHRVRADPRRLQQVLWNLLGNAAKFTPDGGSVTVRTDNPDPDTLRVRVTDTGVGIAPDLLSRIFEPFERGEGEHRYEYSGLGLGLAIARSLLQRMGGEVRAQSDGPGQGSTFTVTMPLLRGDSGPSERPAAPAGPVSARAPLRARVLLVEDHATTAEILARLLRRLGCEAVVAHGVAAALQAARAQPAGEPFDLVLSDIGLPDGTGHELLGRLRTAGVTAPAVALSGYGMAADIAASRSAGFVQHLTKPVDFDTLRAALERAIAGERAPGA